MRRLRVYIVAHWTNLESHYYICNTLACRKFDRGLLIEPHFFHEYYSKSGRHVCKNGLRGEQYDMTRDCIFAIGDIMCVIAQDGRLVIKHYDYSNYLIAPLYNL